MLTLLIADCFSSSVKCKCGYDFCWRCMKPWRPTHTDYFNCTAKVWTNHVIIILWSWCHQVSKAARDAKKLVDYNQRCASHHKSKVIITPLLSISSDFFSVAVCTKVVCFSERYWRTYSFKNTSFPQWCLWITNNRTQGEFTQHSHFFCTNWSSRYWAIRVLPSTTLRQILMTTLVCLPVIWTHVSLLCKSS